MKGKWLLDLLISRLMDVHKQIHNNVRSSAWNRFAGMASIVLVTAIWGYGNIAIDQGEVDISPIFLLWLRFAIAAVFMFPLILRIRLPIRQWALGLATGSLLGLSVLAQGLGMKTISVDDVAFLSALYVVFTPLAEALLKKTVPAKLLWFAIALSMFGAWLLVGRLTIHFRIGLVWSILAALGFTAQILGTESLSDRMTATQFGAMQVMGAGTVLTVISVVVMGKGVSGFPSPMHWSVADWFHMGYLILPATVLGAVFQTWGQSRVSSTHAAIAFNMEPVWTVAFAWFILSLHLTTQQWIGAACVISGMLSISQVPYAEPR